MGEASVVESVVRVGRLACILLSALVAGCFGSGSPTVEPAGPGYAAAQKWSMPWGLEECAFVVVYVTVDSARLQARLPAGFTPLPFATAGDVPVAAALGFEGFDCRRGMGANSWIDALDYGSVFAPVRPPPEYVREGIQNYYVKWDVLVPDGERRASLVAAGVPARAGTMTREVTGSGATHGVVSAILDMEALGTLRLRAIAQPEAASNGFSFIEYTPTPHGLVAWKGVASGTSIARGPADVELPPGSWVATLVGHGRAVTTRGAIGTYTFTNASIELPSPRG